MTPGLPTFSTWSNGLSKCWARPSSIRSKNLDRGQIIIDYQSREEFDRLAVLLQRSEALPTA